MRDTARAITKLLLIAAVWFSVMLAAALALLLPMGALYSAFELAPEIRAASTMTIAIATATVAAALMWNHLRAVASSAPAGARTVSGAADNDAEAPFATTG